MTGWKLQRIKKNYKLSVSEFFLSEKVGEVLKKKIMADIFFFYLIFFFFFFYSIRFFKFISLLPRFLIIVSF